MVDAVDARRDEDEEQTKPPHSQVQKPEESDTADTTEKTSTNRKSLSGKATKETGKKKPAARKPPAPKARGKAAATKTTAPKGKGAQVKPTAGDESVVADTEDRIDGGTATRPDVHEEEQTDLPSLLASFGVRKDRKGGD